MLGLSPGPSCVLSVSTSAQPHPSPCFLPFDVHRMYIAASLHLGKLWSNLMVTVTCCGFSDDSLHLQDHTSCVLPTCLSRPNSPHLCRKNKTKTQDSSPPLSAFSLVENRLALQGMTESRLAPVQPGGPCPTGLSANVGWFGLTSFSWI